MVTNSNAVLDLEVAYIHVRHSIIAVDGDLLQKYT